MAELDPCGIPESVSAADIHFCNMHMLLFCTPSLLLVILPHLFILCDVLVTLWCWLPLPSGHPMGTKHQFNCG